jgi:Na+-driven multidrug efflux pump
MAYYFCYKWGWNMFGVALASSIQMTLRWVILKVICQLDKNLERSEIPLMHPDSWKDLEEMAVIGW